MDGGGAAPALRRVGGLRRTADEAAERLYIALLELQALDADGLSGIEDALLDLLDDHPAVTRLAARLHVPS